MKPTLPHIHCNSATDRTHGLTRTAAVILAALLLTPTAIPAVSALSAPKHAPSVEETTREQAPLQSITIQTDLVSDRGILTPADPARMTAELMETIRFVRDRFDMTVLLIEHDMNLVSGICDELTVLNFGLTLAHGGVSEVLNDPEVIKAYLGD